MYIEKNFCFFKKCEKCIYKYMEIIYDKIVIFKCMY